jgi:diguanylate cyclase (GGDEF)-like protein
LEIERQVSVERFRTQFSYIALTISLLSNFLFIAFCIHIKALTPAFVLGGGMLLYLLVVWMFRRHWTQLGRIALLLIYMLNVAAMAVFFSPAAGIHYYFIVASLTALILVDISHMKTRIIIVAYLLASLVLLIAFHRHNFMVDIDIDPAWIARLRGFNEIATLVIIFVGFGYFAHVMILAQKRLLHAAIHDPLTDILNRRGFFYRAEQEWQRSIRYDSRLSLLVMDLDFFKRVNDSHGHQAGDVVLLGFVRAINACIRPMDLFARIGGEEFCVLLPETDEAHALLLAERLRTRIEALKIDVNGHVIGITVSIGLCSRCDTHQSMGDLHQKADAALYQAKRQGRNRVEKAIAVGMTEPVSANRR